MEQLKRKKKKKRTIWKEEKKKKKKKEWAIWKEKKRKKKKSKRPYEKKKKKEMDYMKRNGKKEEERKSWTIWIMFQNVTDVQSKRRPKGPKVGNWPQKKNNFLLQNQQQQVLVVEKRLSCALGISGPSVFKYGTNNWPNLSAIPAATRWRRTEKTLLCIWHK